jgi:putative FmdB family regulatory protein
MPTYEYQCPACGHEFEKFQSITANPIRKCPRCGKSRVKRLIGTGAGIIFRGNGFYQTDYRSESYRKGAEKDQSSSSEETASSKKSGESTDKPQGSGSEKKPD